MKFKVGDRVRIRQWDDMRKEFGLGGGGSINCTGSFICSMRDLCGEEFVISELSELSLSKTALKVRGLETGWTITTDMIELVDGDGMIRKVIFNDPATIVFWSDGSKTVVKAQDGNYDKMVGLAMCISKKHFGNKGNYYNEFKKWIGEGDK